MITFDARAVDGTEVSDHRIHDLSTGQMLILFHALYDKLYNRLIDKRQDPDQYGCPECLFRHDDESIVSRHLRDFHKYPEEDSNVGVVPLYK